MSPQGCFYAHTAQGEIPADCVAVWDACGLRTYYLPASGLLEVCIDLDFALSVLLCRSACAYHTIHTTSLVATVLGPAALLLRVPRYSTATSRFLTPCRPFLCATAKCALQRACKRMRPLGDMPEAWESLDLRAEVIGRRTMKSGRQSIMSKQPLFFFARSVVLQVMGVAVALLMMSELFCCKSCCLFSCRETNAITFTSPLSPHCLLSSIHALDRNPSLEGVYLSVRIAARKTFFLSISTRSSFVLSSQTFWTSRGVLPPPPLPPLLRTSGNDRIT